MVSVAIDHLCFKVRYNNYMMVLTINFDDVVLVGTNPGTNSDSRKASPQGVFLGLGATLCAHRPGVNFIATADNAVGTAGSMNIGILWGQRDIILRNVF
jgi:hypothetical protein